MAGPISTFRTFLQNHGWGNRARSTAPSPIHRNTTTDRMSSAPYVMRDPDRASSQASQSGQLGSAPSAQPSALPSGQSTGVAKRNELLAEQAKHLALLGDRDAYLSVLRDQHRFQPAQARDLHALEHQFQQVMTRCPQRADMSPVLAGSRMLILANAVSRACERSPADAARALALLGNLDLMACLRHPEAATVDAATTHPYAGETRQIHGHDVHITSLPCPAVTGSTGSPEGRFSRADLANAWRIAHALAETPVGFALLREMTATPAEYTGQNDAVQEERGVLLRSYLNAAREKSREAGVELAPDPHSIHQYLLAHPIAEAQFIRDAANRVANAITHAAQQPGVTYAYIDEDARLTAADAGRGFPPATQAAWQVHSVLREAAALAQDPDAIGMADLAAEAADAEMKKAIAAAATSAIAFLPPDAEPSVVEDARRLQGAYGDILGRLENLSILQDRHAIVPNIFLAARPSSPNHVPLMEAIERAVSDPDHQRQIARAAAVAAGGARPLNADGTEAPLSDLQRTALKRVSVAAAQACKAEGASPMAVFEAIWRAVPRTQDDVVAEAVSAVPGKHLIPSGTLLDKALLAIKDHAGKVDALAREPENQAPPFHFPEDQRSEYAWAIHAVKCGIYTDKEEDDKGNPTLFGKLNGYMNDLSRQIEVVGEQAETRNPRKRKELSPFNGYHSLAGEDGLGLDDTLRGSLHTGREMRFVLIPEVVKGLMRFGSANGGPITTCAEAIFPQGINGLTPAPIEANPPEVTLRNLVRIALLNAHQARAQYISEFNGVIPLGETEMARVRNAIYDQLEGGFDSQSPQTVANIVRLCEELNVRLTIDELMKWIKDIPGAPQSFEEAMTLRETQHPVPKALPDWGRVGQSIALVVSDEVAPLEVANLDGTLPEIGIKPGQVSPQDASRVITGAIAGMNEEAEADTAIFLYDGKTRGFNPVPAMEALTAAKSAEKTGGSIVVTVGAGPTFKGYRGVAYSNDTGVAGSEQYGGKRNDKELGFAARASIGEAFVGPFRRAISAGGSISWVNRKSEGFMIRDQRWGEVPDREHPWADVKGQHNDLLVDITNRLLRPDDPPPGTAWCEPGDRNDAESPLKFVLHQGSSVNLREMHERGLTWSFRAGYGLSSTMPESSASSGGRFKADGVHTFTRIREGDRRTVGGGDQKFKTVDKDVISVNVGGALGPLSAIVPEIPEEVLRRMLGIPAPGDIPESSTPVTGDLAAHDRTVLVSGKITNFNQLVRNNTIRPNSYYTEVYQTLAGLAKSILPELDEIAVDKAERTYGAQWRGAPAAIGDQERAERIQAVRELFLNIFEIERKRGVQGAPHFWKYNEINPNVWEELSHLESQMVEAEKAGKKRLARACRRQFEAAKADPKSYITKLILVIGYPTETKTKGLDGLIVWQRNTTATTSDPAALF